MDTLATSVHDSATFTVSDTVYGVLSGYWAQQIQIVNLSNPTDISVVDTYSYGSRPTMVETFTTGGTPYAIVIQGGALRFMDLSDPSDVTLVSSAVPTDASAPTQFTKLWGASDVATIAANDKLYAIAISNGERNDPGVQVIDITDPNSLSAVDTLNLDAAHRDMDSIDTFTVGENQYAIVTSRLADAILILDLTDPANISLVDTVTNGNNGLTGIDDPRGVSAYEIGGVP